MLTNAQMLAILGADPRVALTRTRVFKICGLMGLGLQHADRTAASVTCQNRSFLVRSPNQPHSV